MTDSGHRINVAQLANLCKELEIEVIKFTFWKIQKQITSKVDKLQLYDPQHPIHQLSKGIRFIDETSMRTGGDVLLISRALTTMTHGIICVWCGRGHLKSLLKSSGQWSIPMGGSLILYLRKVMSIMADIKNVIRAAILPQSRGVFGRIPTIIGLPD
jgi:hypothetical protein